MERNAYAIVPPRPVQYRGQGYVFESFDVGKVEFMSEGGRRRVWFDDEDVYCVLVDSMTGRRLRIHLQDAELEL